MFLERREFIVLPSIPKSILWLCPNQKFWSPNCLDSSRLITYYLLKFLLGPSSHFLFPQLTPQIPDLPSLNISIVICVTCLLPIYLNYYVAQWLCMLLDIHEINAVVHLVCFFKHWALFKHGQSSQFVFHIAQKSAHSFEIIEETLFIKLLLGLMQEYIFLF